MLSRKNAIFHQHINIAGEKVVRIKSLIRFLSGFTLFPRFLWFKPTHLLSRMWTLAVIRVHLACFCWCCSQLTCRRTCTCSPFPPTCGLPCILNGREAGPGPQAAAVLVLLKVGQSPSKLDKGPFIRTSVKALSHVR